MRVPKVLDCFANPIAPVASYVAAPFCVAAVAWLVKAIHKYVLGVEGGYAHPNLILFLLPITLLAILGGKGPGMVTLLLSGAVSAVFLMQPFESPRIDRAADIVGLGLMLLAGFLLILGLDFIRNAARIQTDVTHEIARLHQRSQRIASAFQEPLIPKIAGPTDGLAIAHYYKPALDEAMVGGDFLDVFQTDHGDTVLVLGDISGKGLQAATQIPTVKNMLRFALHRKNPAELGSVLGEINDAVAVQELLSGFATLFVAMFDKDTRRLTYVSCGHEPALLRRAGGRGVEELPPTGPILGPFAGSRYEMEERMLDTGDTLVVYTDGLSDSGPDRSRMLGGAGLKRLLAGAKATGDTATQNIVDRIIRGTKRHARGRLSDDACLLVCMVEAVKVPDRRYSDQIEPALSRPESRVGAAKP